MTLRPAWSRLELLVLLVVFSRGEAFAQSPPRDQPPELVASTEARTPEEERQGFHLPPGFVMELVACEPDIQKPMNLAFDARGRLWVTSSVEYPYPVQGDETGRDHLTILDDFGPDGRARKVTVFADDLNIPIGVLPLRDGVLVHSIPNIYLMRDRDGDDRADEREVWYGSYGFRDTHGMTSALTWGFDGWIYACHGFANDSTVKGADGRSIRMNSGNTYRMRPDGSHVEQYTWGQVNPFGLSFSPQGDLFSADCHSRPIMFLLREGYYPSFGKPHDGLGFAPEIMTHDHGSTGIAGISYYAAGQFPKAYRGSILIGNVVTSRINRDRLKWHGSSPQAIPEADFVVSDDPWFRPVDIELGPDGCLYVADFYNRIIGHYEVPLEHPGRDRERGRIWRIRYDGDEPHAEAQAPRTDWTKASVDELIADLGHANPAVRTLAANELAERGGAEVRAAVRAARADGTNPLRRVQALWVAFRLGLMDDMILRDAAFDSDHRLVRTHAMRVLGEQPALSPVQRALALAGLTDAHPFVIRAAAEALGRHPDEANLRPLLDARHAAPENDPQRVHVIRIALRDQLRDLDLWPRLAAGSWSEADRRALADVALGVASAPAARYLLNHIRTLSEPDPVLLRMIQHISRNGDAGTDPELLAFVRSRDDDGLKEQTARLRAMEQGAQERGRPLPPAARTWAVELATAALGSNEAVGTGIELAAAMRLGEVRATLTTVALMPGNETGLRASALAALPVIDPSDAIAPISAVLAEAASPTELREQAANLLGQIGQPRARAALETALPTAPSRVQRAIATALAGSRAGTERLLAAVTAGKASAELLQGRAIEVRLRRSGVPEIEQKLAELTKGLEPADKQTQIAIDVRRSGFGRARTDPKAGEAAFTKHCAACHTIDGKGAKVGPQLDGIGVRGPDRLLEDVLDPNRNVDQAFRANTLALADGRVVTGLILREEGDVLVLADNQGKEIRVPKGEVEEKAVTPLSLMPANFAEQIGEEEFYNLLGYLLSRKEGGPAPGPSRSP